MDDVVLECGQGIHFIHGLNGQGKTSLLEAIYLLSNLKSFRDSDLAACVQSGQSFASVKGLFKLDATSEAELRLDLVQGPSRFEKRAYINQKLAKSALDYFGVKQIQSAVHFHAINLNPTSTDLIRGEPSLRRNYLNQVISSETPNYMDVLKKFQKSLDQKNALLKQEERVDLQLLNILNENIIQTGAILIHGRISYLEKIGQPVLDFLSQIAPHQKPVNLAYRTSETLYFTGQFELPTVKILEENLHQKLVQMGTQERVRRTSLVGPHRDDLVFKVGEKLTPLAPDLVNVGSQGEIRSLLLSLKLAELEEFKRQTGVQPVLLIDDFSSELDSTRREFLLNYLKNSELQIFVTSTDDLSGSLEATGKTIRMSRGKVIE